MKLVFFVLALAAVYVLTRSESFQEDGDFVEQKAQISPTKNQEMIFVTQKYLKEKLKLCTYCIETNKIQVFGRPSDLTLVKYKARYMFLVFSTYPYGIAVDVEIMDGKILSLATQPSNVDAASSEFIPFTDEIAHEFLAYDQLAQKPSPVTSDDTKK